VSARQAKLATVILAAAGIAVAAYLTWVHYAGVEPICTGASDCERVQSSEYAEVGAIPVALIGLLGYAGILAAALVPGCAARLVGAYLAFTGAGFSAYLTWVELAQIEAICQWCVVSGVLMGTLALVALLRRDDGPAATPARACPAPRPRTRARGSHRASRRARASR
jgi:uncharacterized membrane protein